MNTIEAMRLVCELAESAQERWQEAARRQKDEALERQKLAIEQVRQLAASLEEYF